MAKAILIRIGEPDKEKGHAPAVVIRESTSNMNTVVRNWSEVIEKAKDQGLDPDTEVDVSLETVRWLKDQEGWPEGQRVTPR